MRSANGGAWSAVRRRLPRFGKDVARRFRNADGATHTRALAFQSVLVFLSGFIGLVGLASALGVGSLSLVVQRFATRLAPGPSGRLLQEAVAQGTRGASTAAIFGLGAAVVAGTLAMAQVERSANRLDGVTEDRPAAQRYAVAFLLALSAGVLLVLGGLLIAAGRTIGTGLGWSGEASTAWAIVRWPLGVLIAGAATFLMFGIAPHRSLGSRRVLAAGAVVAVALWIVFTVLLGVYLAVGNSSKTYGPLLAVVALLLWAELTSLAVHLGLATSCEIARSGSAPSPLVSPRSAVASARRD